MVFDLVSFASATPKLLLVTRSHTLLSHKCGLSIFIILLGSSPGFQNLVSGSTGAYFQLNRVSSAQGVIPSTHGNVPYSPEGQWLTGYFLDSHLEGSAIIADPYAELGTPELE